MAKESASRRKAAPTVKRAFVKTTICVDGETHSLWALAAAIEGMDRSAWAVKLIKNALQGLVVIDKRKPVGDVDPSTEDDRSDAA